MSARPSKDEIDRGILDVTAGLIARHGVRATSTQLVADAVGYSKAAIFQRFGSKEELIERALRQCVELGQDARSQVAALPAGPAKDRAGLAALIDLGMRWQGFLALAISSVTVRERGELGADLERLADAMLAMFDLERPAGANDTERLFRALGALSVVAVLGLAYADYTDDRTARGIILEAAVSTLG